MDGEQLELPFPVKPTKGGSCKDCKDALTNMEPQPKGSEQHE